MYPGGIRVAFPQHEQCGLLRMRPLLWLFSECAPELKFTRISYEYGMYCIEQGALFLACWYRSPKEFKLMAPPQRRLEDKIRELCMRVGNSSDRDFERTFAELRAAMNEHLLRMRNKTSATILGWPEFPRNRRKAFGGSNSKSPS